MIKTQTEPQARVVQSIGSLLHLADEIAASGIPPMSMQEINAEVKAARAERQLIRNRRP